MICIHLIGSTACKPEAKKHPLASDTTEGNENFKQGSCAEKLGAVEEIVKRLKKKHGTKYSVDKLNVWAHMLHIEKHDSDEVPPKVLYFTKIQNKLILQNACTSDHADCSIKKPVVLSLVKRVSLRTEA